MHSSNGGVYNPSYTSSLTDLNGLFCGFIVFYQFDVTKWEQDKEIRYCLLVELFFYFDRKSLLKLIKCGDSMSVNVAQRVK